MAGVFQLQPVGVYQPNSGGNEDRLFSDLERFACKILNTSGDVTKYLWPAHIGKDILCSVHFVTSQRYTSDLRWS